MTKAVGQLSPQPWLTDGAMRALMAVLNHDGETRFVGGCVRDGLLRRPVQDVDLATTLLPDQVMARLAGHAVRVIPTGLSHGTVTALMEGGRCVEITTLRRDVHSDGRHALVAFTTDWREDAARRDFTMNAMSADQDGLVYDYFDGLVDLAACNVRFVGDPVRRIQEDVLRLLRFFRFSAHYGTPPLNHHGLVACRKLAHLLPGLSGERVAAELFKLLAAADPSQVLAVMVQDGILAPLLPQARRYDVVKVLSWLESRALVRPGIGPDPLRRLAALLEGGAKEAAALLKLSRADRLRLERLCRLPARFDPDQDPACSRRLIEDLGNALFRDHVLLAWAVERAGGGGGGSARSASWGQALDLADTWMPPSLPVGGADILELGIAAGPKVGDVLHACRDWWRDQDFVPDRDQCLLWLKSRLG